MPPLVARLLAPRLLPWLISVMAALVVVKLGGVALELGSPVLARAGRAIVPPAIAAEHAAAPSPPPQPASPPQAGPPPPAASPAATAAQEPGPSVAERAVLLDLRTRRTALEERARTLDSRQAVLDAAERRLSERVQQLSALQTKLEALDQSRRERDEANWRGLVKTYETMRPKDAAAILNDLDKTVLLQVLDRMKEAKVAPILAAMQPERARAATAELARWRNRTVEPQG